MLRRNTSEGCKQVEVYENESPDTEMEECVSLNGIWTVQDKESQSKKRFAFEVNLTEKRCVLVCVYTVLQCCSCSFHWKTSLSVTPTKLDSLLLNKLCY